MGFVCISEEGEEAVGILYILVGNSGQSEIVVLETGSKVGEVHLCRVYRIKDLCL